MKINTKKFILTFLALTFLFSIAFLLTAWVAEDAFITFRSVRNVLDGFGPVWNIGERVQVYTHPLWFGLMVFFNWLYYDPYYIVIGMSYICLLIWIFLISKLFITQLAKHADSQSANNTNNTSNNHYNYSYAIMLVVVLVFSRGFIDFLSSGLENPLINVIAALFVLTFISEKPLPKKLFLLSLLIALGYLTRPDTIFFLAPPLLYVMYRYAREYNYYLKPFFLGLIPFFLWEIFSIIYYGSFVPNTALAKVNTGYTLSTKLQQSYNYFEFNLLNDPVTILFIAFAVFAGIYCWLKREKDEPKLPLYLFLIAGIILHILYVIMVGADYMMGRFLAPLITFAVAVLLLLPQREWLKNTYAIVPIVLLFSFVAANFHKTSPFSSRFDYKKIAKTGISDERGYFYAGLGLMPILIDYDKNPYVHSWIGFGREFDDKPNQVALSCVIGMQAWSADPSTYWIDPLALTEPFLARLPAKDNARPGHYERAFPAGYFHSKVVNRNEIKEPLLHRLYEDVELVTKGPLFSSERWAAIWRLNSRHYKNLDQHFDKNDIGLSELNLPPVSRHFFSCVGLGAFSHLIISKPKP